MLFIHGKGDQLADLVLINFNEVHQQGEACGDHFLQCVGGSCSGQLPQNAHQAPVGEAGFIGFQRVQILPVNSHCLRQNLRVEGHHIFQRKGTLFRNLTETDAGEHVRVRCALLGFYYVALLGLPHQPRQQGWGILDT